MLLSVDESWPTSSCMLASVPGMTEATAAKRMDRLFSPCSGRQKKKKNGREMAGRGRQRQANLSKLHTRTATPSLLLWVSCSHAGYESE